MLSWEYECHSNCRSDCGFISAYLPRTDSLRIHETSPYLLLLGGLSNTHELLLSSVPLENRKGLLKHHAFLSYLSEVRQFKTEDYIIAMVSGFSTYSTNIKCSTEYFCDNCTLSESWFSLHSSSYRCFHCILWTFLCIERLRSEETFESSLSISWLLRTNTTFDVTWRAMAAQEVMLPNHEYAQSALWMLMDLFESKSLVPS